MESLRTTGLLDEYRICSLADYQRSAMRSLKRIHELVKIFVS
jgi:hypothetical protein